MHQDGNILLRSNGLIVFKMLPTPLGAFSIFLCVEYTSYIGDNMSTHTDTSQKWTIIRNYFREHSCSQHQTCSFVYTLPTVAWASKVLLILQCNQAVCTIANYYIVRSELCVKWICHASHHTHTHTHTHTHKHTPPLTQTYAISSIRSQLIPTAIGASTCVTSGCITQQTQVTATSIVTCTWIEGYSILGKI